VPSANPPGAVLGKNQQDVRVFIAPQSQREGVDQGCHPTSKEIANSTAKLRGGGHCVMDCSGPHTTASIGSNRKGPRRERDVGRFVLVVEIMIL